MTKSKQAPGSYSHRKQTKRLKNTSLRHSQKQRWVGDNSPEAIASIVPKHCTIIDLGAGIGAHVLALQELGCDVEGVDGSPDIHHLTNGLIRWVDLTADCSEFYRKYDWGLFSEVGEHVPVVFEERLIDQVCQIPTKGLIVSWAWPDRWRISGHVNCRSEDYVIKRFEEQGWELDGAKTTKYRSFGGSRYVKRTMVFIGRKQ